MPRKWTRSRRKKRRRDRRLPNREETIIEEEAGEGDEDEEMLEEEEGITSIDMSLNKTKNTGNRRNSNRTERGSSLSLADNRGRSHLNSSRLRTTQHGRNSRSI